MVLQDPYTALDPRMTAAEIVGEPFQIHPDVMPRARRRAAVAELFELVGLNPDHLHRYPHQFSGGQRQRIGIARALALRPRIIVCDEPVSALDLSVQAQVLNLLIKLQRELSLSYVFIGHDLSVVRHVSDRIAVMYLGTIVETGTEADIYETPQHPYTKALLSSVPDPAVLGRRERIVLRGEIPSAAAAPAGCAFSTRCWMAEDICATSTPALEAHGHPRHLAACHFAG
jgi:oligopeptide transport system ATP-binding protein